MLILLVHIFGQFWQFLLSYLAVRLGSLPLAAAPGFLRVHAILAIDCAPALAVLGQLDHAGCRGPGHFDFAPHQPQQRGETGETGSHDAGVDFDLRPHGDPGPFPVRVVRCEVGEANGREGVGVKQSTVEKL